MSDTFKGEILSVILRFGAVTRESLFLIRNDQRYTERVIKKCLQDGYIDEHVRKDVVKVDYLAFAPIMKLKRVVNGHKEKKPPVKKEEHHYFRTLKYYTITDYGIEYLIGTGRCSKDMAAAADLLRKQFSRGGRSIDRLLGISQSELLLWTTNAVDPDVYSYNEDQVMLQGDYGFANAKTIKYIAQNGSKTMGITYVSHDYDRGRYNGCYFTSKAAMAVYNNLSPGFSWSKNAADPEKRAIELFVNAIKHKNNIVNAMDVSACVLVNNPNHLKQIYLDLPGARRIVSASNSKAYVLGDPFAAMYAIPISMTGAYHLYDILNRKSYEKEIQLLHYYWRKGFKSDISIPGPTLVKMVLDDVEISYTVSLTLDLRYMQLMQKYMKIYPRKKYGVICYDWQIPYWKSLFGADFPIIEAPCPDE